jgi:hypothetical protein
MTRTRLVAVACRISRSGFSGERVFRVQKSDGTDYVGAAPVHYFTAQGRRPIADSVPATKGEQVPGWIEGILIENGGDEANVVFPGGEMVRVKTDQIQWPSPEAASHVPV